MRWPFPPKGPGDPWAKPGDCVMCDRPSMMTVEFFKGDVLRQFCSEECVKASPWWPREITWAPDPPEPV